MKTTIFCAFACALTLAARAAIVVPGADGSDGVLNITANTEIDLSQAVTGTWDQNNAANAGKGVYDPAKWAVVFKYSSVTVAPNVTVTFKNHASRAPVVWLVSGNVTISGTVSLDGETPGYNSPMIAEPGPGGYRGGQGNFTSGIGASAGFGIGGGNAGSWGGGGSYGTTGVGGYGNPSHGNPSIIPLVGGSGGGGYSADARGGGAGGGGALIVSTNQISVAGIVTANGGGGAGGMGGGSGGSIRLVADSIEGIGILRCLGGTGTNVHSGGLGRIRLERVGGSGELIVNPDPSIVPLAAGTTALLWPPAEAPEVRIVSVGEVNTPVDPRASFGSAGADVALPQITSTPVLIETTNVEQVAVVNVRVTPRSDGNVTVITATFDTIVSTNPLVIRWVASLPVNTGYSALQVHVVRP